MMFIKSLTLLFLLSVGQNNQRGITAGTGNFKHNYPYSEIDFFKEQKKLFCWSGPLYSQSRKFNAPDIPTMIYNDPAVGQCRIICYPKAGLKQWEALIKKIGNLDSVNRRVRDISLNKELQEQYAIYGFFVDKKYLAKVDDPGDPNAMEITYPCHVKIFKKGLKGWFLLKQVKTSRDKYHTLIVDTILDSKGLM